jgi:aryl-alcohol dehydrogenase-like predicted oxidoreductase
MQYRPLGRTGMDVSVIGFGAWAIGGFWGATDDDESMRALHTAIDAGVNFIDTADVYGDGRSERLIARLKRERRLETIYVATKAGRRLDRQTVEGYSRENLSGWIDRSLANLKTDAIDLLQLHCPPIGVYDRPEIFGVLDDLVAAGKLRHYGVSVETVDEAQRAIQNPRVQSVQIIFNLFRPKPAEAFFQDAARRRVGIIAGQRAADRQALARFDVPRRRPPHLQPIRTDVRRRRDVLRRAARRRSRGCREAAAARPARDDVRPVRAPLDPDVGCGDVHDSRRAHDRAGAREQRGRRPAAAVRGCNGCCQPDLRQARAASRARPMVVGQLLLAAFDRLAARKGSTTAEKSDSPSPLAIAAV